MTAIRRTGAIGYGQASGYVGFRLPRHQCPGIGGRWFHMIRNATAFTLLAAGAAAFKQAISDLRKKAVIFESHNALDLRRLGGGD